MSSRLPIGVATTNSVPGIRTGSLLYHWRMGIARQLKRLETVRHDRDQTRVDTALADLRNAAADPERYPVERIITFAGWLMREIAP